MGQTWTVGMEMFFYEFINFFLRGIKVFQCRAHGLERLAVGVKQFAQVGGIDLRVAAEPAEILVNDRGIQKGEKPDGQMAIQSVTVGVKIVQVVFEADPFCVEGLWIEQAGDQAAAFLLGSKPFRQQIHF